MLRMLRNPYREIEKKIGYRFRNKALLEMALTHRSYRFENEGVTCDNQRLEFLGDAVLGAVAGAFVYAELPDDDEGVLTAVRSSMTSGRALGALGKELELGAHLLIGKGECNSGGRERASTLADGVEAVLGAAYLDGGLKAVLKIFAKLFAPHAEEYTHDATVANPKGKLQELAQKSWQKSPVYRVTGTVGPAHAKVFSVEVSLPDGSQGTGKAANKQDAEARAAADALKRAPKRAPKRASAKRRSGSSRRRRSRG